MMNAPFLAAIWTDVSSFSLFCEVFSFMTMSNINQEDLVQLWSYSGVY